MTRVDITLGLLAVVGTIALIALIGLGEEERMSRADRGYDMRSVETGAQMFNQYCMNCHGVNGAGLNCPPLNETSGLHAGDLGPGVAWRLEELHWDRTDVFGYVYSTIAAGRTISTRPDRYRGLSPDIMQMPAWSQKYNGPLRDDQVMDLANYVVNFREFFPAAGEDGALEKACTTVLDTMAEPGAPAPSATGYESKCYETLCTAKIKATDEDFVMPKKPVPVKPDDAKYKGKPELLRKDQEQYAKDAQIWSAFWARCQTLGGKLPPTPAATSVPPTAGALTTGTPLAESTGTPTLRPTAKAGATLAVARETATPASP